MVLNKDRTVENDSLMNEALYEYNYTLRYNKWPLRIREKKKKYEIIRGLRASGFIFNYDHVFLSIFGKKKFYFEKLFRL